MLGRNDQGDHLFQPTQVHTYGCDSIEWIGWWTKSTFRIKVYFNVEECYIEFGCVLSFVVFFQASKDWIDVTFKQAFSALYTHFLAELFVVSCAESGHRCTKNTLELAPRVIIVKDIVGWILAILPLAIPPFNYVYAIVFTIK